MPEPGQTLSHYRLIAKIGEGGMGVVWKAVDTTLEREVAIKILPESLSTDAERMARFEREAKLLGSLNHPNIATVHGLHDVEGTRFIEMEFVPGEDLSQRLARCAVPVDETKEIAGQIASALEAAHERGVIHRDLKPANVRITEDGQVKVLDFGLAKTLEGDTGASYDPDLSPTLTSDRTRDGVILGTAAYMSPEQARGRAVDRRCDVWAFGCLLYECLTGKKPFPGETISDALAAILKNEPDWRELPAETPEALRRLLRRCLAKEPRRRLSSLGDARLEIEEADEQWPSSALAVRSGSRWSPWLVLSVVAALLIVVLAIFWSARGVRNPEEAISFKQLTYQRGWISSARISPDGQTIVYSAAWRGEPLRLLLRRLDSTGALPVPLEPSHARLLSISSRGELAILLPPESDVPLLPLFRDGTLARVPITGGTPRAVAENVFAADWDPSGETLALVRGGESGARLEFPAGNLIYASSGWISTLRVSPDGEFVAFFEHAFANNNRGYVAIVGRDGKVQRLTPELESLTGLAWSPSGGEVWFSGADDLGKALFAVPLSSDFRVLRRSADILILHDTTPEGLALVADDDFRLGISALAPGERSEQDLSWMGTSFVTDITADGESILFMRQDQLVYDIWLRRLDGSAPVRLGPGVSLSLSPDGNWALAGSFDLSSPLTLLPTGAGEPRRLEGTEGAFYAALTPDGRSVVWASGSSAEAARLNVRSIDGGKARTLSEDEIVTGVDRPFRISPDARWVAALGPDETIKLYPLEGGEPQALPGFRPGDEPAGWTADGRFFFVSRSDTLPAQFLRLDLETGARQIWHEMIPQDPAGIGGIFAFSITPDGKAYAYTYARKLDSLYLMTGLK
jgi:serine/threonine protein kinase